MLEGNKKAEQSTEQKIYSEKGLVIKGDKRRKINFILKWTKYIVLPDKCTRANKFNFFFSFFILTGGA